MNFKSEISQKLNEIFENPSIEIYESKTYLFKSFFIILETKTEKLFGRWYNKDKERILFENEIIKLLINSEVNIGKFKKFGENYNIDTDNGSMFFCEYIECESFPVDGYILKDIHENIVNTDISTLTFINEYYIKNNMNFLVSKNQKLMYFDPINNIFKNDNDIFFNNLSSYELLDERFKDCIPLMSSLCSPYPNKEELILKYIIKYNLNKEQFLINLNTYCSFLSKFNKNKVIKTIVDIIKKIKGDL